MFKRVRILGAMVAIVTMLLLITGCGRVPEGGSAGGAQDKDKTFTIKLAHESPATHSKGIWAEDFKKAVEEKSGSRIKVELYHQGQLYSSEEAAIQAAINGLIQVAIPSTGYMSTIVPQFQVADLPMIFKDQEALSKFEDGEIGRSLMGTLDGKGLKGLGYISNVPLDLFSKQKMVEPADFRGKKIRAHTAVLEASIKALGGNPVSMPASDMYLGLEQGIINGAFTTVTFAAPNKYQEVTPYLTRARISAIAYPVVMNLKFWQGLPDDLKTAVAEAVQYATEQNRANLSKQEEKAVSSLQAGGIEVIELTAGQRQQWLSALQNVYDEFKNTIGADLMQKVQSL